MVKLDEAHQNLLNRLAGEQLIRDVEELEITRNSYMAHRRMFEYLESFELINGGTNGHPGTERRREWIWLTEHGWNHVTDPRIRALRKLRNAS